MIKRALLLVNVGTPDNPSKKDVRRYLTGFLNDRRVIDLPWLLRKILVNLIIIPFRTKKSTGLYQRLWTPKGSPLLIYLNSLVEKLQQSLQGRYRVYGAMRYGNPALKEVLKQIQHEGVEEITVFPLYPQYASSTTGSVVEEVFHVIGKWEVIPAVRVVKQFYNHPAFLNAFARQIASFNPDAFDHVIFSYHGLPIRQIDKTHSGIPASQCNCIHEMPAHGTFCYRATCYETTRQLIKILKLTPEKTTVSYQSRLSKNWLEPFTDEVILKLAEKGVKRILVVAPAFVADCLETIVEIEDYNLLFKKHGGEELVLVTSLNDGQEWMQAVTKIIESN